MKPKARNLNLCFTMVKPPSSPEHHLPLNHSRPFSNTSPSLLIKNFNSLYESPDHHATSETDSNAAVSPDVATAFASRRFFFSSPGRSNSIIDSSSLASTSSSILSTSIPHENDTVAVSTYSPDPFMDFRQSMEEMVEAREIHDVRENWDYLHELLMCYLSLNPKSTHKFIFGAFADLLVSLTTSPLEMMSCRKNLFSDT